MLTVTENKFDWENIPLTDCVKGNALDAYITEKIFHILEYKLKDNGTYKLYEKLLSPLIDKFVQMEYEGMLISKDALEKVEKEIKVKIEAVEDNIYVLGCVKKTDNIDSTKDLKSILFGLIHTHETKSLRDTEKTLFEDKSRLNLYPPKITDKDNFSTDAEALDILLEFITEIVKKNE